MQTHFHPFCCGICLVLQKCLNTQQLHITADSVCENQAHNQPSDNVAHNQPSDNVAHNQPSDNVAHNQPSDNVGRF